MKKHTVVISIVIVFLISVVVSSLAVAHGWKAPKKDSKISTPLMADDINIQTGKKLYSNLCSACHGKNAEGGVNLNLDMKPVPPDLTKRLKGHSDGDFYWKIKTGRGDMPPFKEELEQKEIWQIITYIRSLISD